ncbi:ATP-binding protein [Streptomyces sp. DSM 44915]|uniref:ATP-binding protein n=1 Tax=Streptomyces chisholmiae TaxID=3075540 RepID=A0ABU2JQF1_9ACTN|nr:ATP-binding protein [Streptomyces sp. DSM 44915]MDT0267227.1 ATP-binding protein [Streptomyces sp. DSM 44915]
MTGLLRRLRRRPEAVSARGLLQPVGPRAIQVGAHQVTTAGGVARTLVVTGYPAEANPGWLAPLLNHPGRLDVALHIEPVPTGVAASRLRKQRARLESARRAAVRGGHLDDPEGEAAAADAAELAYRVARGESRLFRVGLYVTVHAPDEEALAEEVASVRAVAESLLLTVEPTTFRALAGWLATRPLGLDPLRVRRTVDTIALTSFFPFASPDIPHTADHEAGGGGVLYGVNALSRTPVFWNRFARSLDNYNSVTLARSGAGKSYQTKLELLRLLFTGARAAVIDPEDEYVRLAEAVGGHTVRLGAGARINPFDLPAPDPADGLQGLVRKVLFLHGFLAVLLGAEPDAARTAVLDQALLLTYERAGITPDVSTFNNPPPTLGDLHQVLGEHPSPAARELADQLVPYVSGSHAQLFNGPSSGQLSGHHLLVFAVRHLPEEVRAPAMVLALDAVWRRVTTGPRRRHLVVVDEAWLLMREREGARFLLRLAKSGRRYWCSLSLVTQDADDVLTSPLGRAIVSNAATQLLLRQSAQAIDQITETFLLSRGERDFLLTARRGETLLLAGHRHRAAVTAVAAGHEHHLVTTDPAELAAREAEQEVAER